MPSGDELFGEFPLAEAATKTRRAKALAELVAMAERGDFDYLLDKKNYRPRPLCSWEP
ncbi:hypothetical protein VMT65_18730 [Nocardia sp. CDC153]|uniref:hypothetical protein n=1 Tax=Nocardia sp. CDC153 TaxID=3112167 RepID=UPI002DBFA87B|nr:hypothetical protein [Nocardia sp. CDC153]MEC3955084.1 hypothetical protein [Nocardia sp. CDC153]